MPINTDEVVKISELAHLELTPDEVQMFSRQLSEIVSYVEKLNQLDTTDVPPMMHAGTSSGSTLREDVAAPSLGQAVATSNAPECRHGQFRVPKVIE
ncbi:MAG: Asp-tRNA(Asn)/Glu-tRNA(Gln) amidotransferase subunit GatC [Acidobacteria bacterium]|nr:Asp-tRNA(Asn)/Glu-tRNA(Gln) amidotransferase subunit GatC [Acidobacteriota bacterium]